MFSLYDTYEVPKRQRPTSQCRTRTHLGGLADYRAGNGDMARQDLVHRAVGVGVLAVELFACILLGIGAFQMAERHCCRTE